MSKQKPAPKPLPAQISAFIEKARELECDESEAAFDAKLRRIAKAKPQPVRKKKAPAK